MYARSFTSIRSYHFRDAVSTALREQREYGGLHLDDYALSDFREMWGKAHAKALEDERARNTRWVSGKWVTTLEASVSREAAIADADWRFNNDWD